MGKISKKLSCTLVLLAVLLSSFSIGFESKASGSVNDYYFSSYSVTSTQLNIYGSLSEFGGDYEQMLPSGTLTVRIPSNLYNVSGGNVNVSADFIKVILQGSSVTINRLVDIGDINIRILSLDLVCNDSKVPLLISSSDWSTAYFDISSFRQNNEISIQDSLFFEVSLFYEIQSAYDGNGNYASFPEVAFTVTVSSPCLTINGYDTVNALKQSLIEQTEQDKAITEKFESDTKTQSDKINELNQQNNTNKIDAEQASSDVDAHIDAEAIGNYGTVLSVFTGNTHILQYILIVLAVALIAYVLFGKR